jgi:3-(3-hydroxy-phenyl)propionate hydroxylase
VLFVGDAAHQVSPFGARGANSGLQDTDNLCWKLQLVMAGKAPERLLDSYSEERVYAADENILNSTRSTDFITPKSNVSLTFRNAVLALAREYPFARALVNSGRLSVPSFLVDSRLNTPDSAQFAGDMVPGAPADDAPVHDGERERWFLDCVGNRFLALVYTSDPGAFVARHAADTQALAAASIPVETLLVVPPGTQVPAGVRALVDRAGRYAERYDAKDGTTYLLRPDQHVAARWRAFDANAVRGALARATCNAQ